MNAPATEEIMRAIAAQAEVALDKALTAAAEDLRKLLGVPVGRQGGKVIRSKPGEYPRKETGRLQASVGHVTYRAANYRVRGTVSTNTPYAQHLDKIRPYKAMFEARWKREVEVRVQFSFR